MVKNHAIYQLSKKFHVTAKRIKTIKPGVYQVKSSSGKNYCLKRMSYPIKRLKWMDTTLRYLCDNGFPFIAWRNPQTRSGQPLYIRPNHSAAPFILTPWIQGAEPNPNLAEDMAECAKAIAVFHQQLQDLSVHQAGAYSTLGKWPRFFQARDMVLKRQVKRATRKDRKNDDEIDRLLRTYGNTLLEQAEAAIHRLRQSDYSQLCRDPSKYGVIHGDSGPKNFILTRNGPFIIDFETLRIDLFIYDLYRLIRLAGKQNGWNSTIAKTILDHYQTIQKLSTAELELLKILLLFPTKPYKILSRIERGNGKNKSTLSRKLRQAIREVDILNHFVKQLDDYHGKA